jgi:hypothetical protein
MDGESSGVADVWMLARHFYASNSSGVYVLMNLRLILFCFVFGKHNLTFNHVDEGFEEKFHGFSTGRFRRQQKDLVNVE